MNDDLARLAPLADPVRRALYELVVRASGPVDRDSAAAGVGIGRAVAAFHLDRLVAAGLLAHEYRRRTGRTGPGAGRPAKFYRRAPGTTVEVSLPPRQYDAVAEILAEAVEPSSAARRRAVEAARAHGADLASELPAGTQRDRRGLVDLLARRGYEPVVDEAGNVRLRNCPFDRLAADHRDLTCSLNLAMLSSVTDEFPDAGLEPVPQPRDGFCCVAFTARDS